MSITSFKESIKKAQKINEAAAAAVAELTSQARDSASGPTPEEITFDIPVEGINLGQLTQELKSIVSPLVEVTVTGNTVVVKTNNKNAAYKTLRKYGVSVQNDGSVAGSIHKDAPQIEI